MKAIFPGSFDPITNGHLDVLRQASNVFDQVIVVIATNTNKKSLFTAAEKKQLAEEATAGLPQVKVVLAPNSLTVQIAQKLGARAIVRGLRNSQDMVYEQDMAFINHEMAPSLQTVFLMTTARYAHLSSTMVRESAQLGGDVSALVPACVQKALKTKFSAKLGDRK
ncbi:MAG: pantetheine-phosphate adenylyltransferase [Lactobacillus sp.]|jgi:pantetheine-phosphate adenylyltransferase